MSSNSLDSAEILDRLAIRDLIENWALWRDAGEQDKFRTVWHDDGIIMATWKQSPAADFIESAKASLKTVVSACIFSAASPSSYPATELSPRPR